LQASGGRYRRATPRSDDEAFIRKKRISTGETTGATLFLYQVVTPDCLPRNASENPGGDSARRLVWAVISSATTVGADPNERLGACLDTRFSAIEPGLSERNLSVYVSPKPEHVATHTTATYCPSRRDEGTCLSGSERRVAMSCDELPEFLGDLDAPVLYENSHPGGRPPLCSFYL
jgi:hypothetical protein